MHRRVVAIAGMLVVSAMVVSHFFGDSTDIEADPGPWHASRGTCQAALDDPPECRSLNQQFSGWVFGRMFGVSVPSLGPQTTPPANLFGWK